MLPREDAAAVGQLLAERFGLPLWQVATTATDANRFALRVARAVTGRHKILVFNGCYHGTVDETFVRLTMAGRCNRPGLLGQVRDLTRGDPIVEFNDLPALEAALSDGDVACVIAEPVLTNSGMVLPEPGFHDGAARPHPRGRHAAAHRRDPHHLDRPRRLHRELRPGARLLRLGKPIAGGMPAGLGLSAESRSAMAASTRRTSPATPAWARRCRANPLQFAAMRATLEEVMTEATYAHMERLAAAGSSRARGRHRAPPPALARRPRRRAGRVRLRGRAAAQRVRGGGRACAALEARHPSRAAQPRRLDRALPQHDAGLAGDDGRRRSTG